MDREMDHAAAEAYIRGRIEGHTETDQDTERLKVALAVLLIKKGSYDELKDLLESAIYHPRWHIQLQKIWHQMHYKIAEKKYGRPIGPVEKFRLRKKYPLPFTIWDGDSVTHNIKDKSRSMLKDFFMLSEYPTLQQRKDLAVRAGLSLTQVDNWFKNRRARIRIAKRKEEIARREETERKEPQNAGIPEIGNLIPNQNRRLIDNPEAHMTQNSAPVVANPLRHEEPAVVNNIEAAQNELVPLYVLAQDHGSGSHSIVPVGLIKSTTPDGAQLPAEILISENPVLRDIISSPQQQNATGMATYTLYQNKILLANDVLVLQNDTRSNQSQENVYRDGDTMVANSSRLNYNGEPVMGRTSQKVNPIPGTSTVVTPSTSSSETMVRPIPPQGDYHIPQEYYYYSSF